MKFITDLIKLFTSVTTGIVFVFIAVMLIEDIDSISTKMLIQMPCAALVTSLVTTAFFCGESRTRRGYYLRILLHYITLCAVMTALGRFFGWVGSDIKGIMTMVISTGAVYVFTFTVIFISSKHEADRLNSALRSKYGGKK